MPWTVQRFSPLLHNDMDRYRDVMMEDRKWCLANNVDYVPCVYPGFSWHNLSVHAFPDDIKPVAQFHDKADVFTGKCYPPPSMQEGRCFMLPC